MVDHCANWRFGDIELHAIDDAVRPARTAQEMFPLAGAALVERHRDWLSQGLMQSGSERLILAYRSWLIRLPGRTILFDLAIGEDKERPGRADMHRVKSNWLNRLGRAGVCPDDIDLVVISHLHMDHVGWATRLVADRWTPTFPRARHIIPEDELTFWSHHHQSGSSMCNSFEDSVSPLLHAGLVDAVAADHQIAEGVRLFALPGHTPGMAGLIVEHRGVRCVLAADVAHHPLQFREPQLSTVFCHDPAKAAETRVQFIERHADTGDIIVPCHFPKPLGHLVRTASGADFASIDAHG